MYVCLCNALTDRDLSEHTAGGDCSVSMVYRACGCQPQCSKCVPFVRQMLRNAADAAGKNGQMRPERTTARIDRFLPSGVNPPV